MMKKANQLRGFLLGMLTMALLMGLLIPAVAASANKTITVSGGLSIFVDGVEMKPTDANGNPVDVFLYNGTTYVPIRAVSQYLGKAVKWDGNTRSVYIGKDPNTASYLLNVCPPYQTRFYEAPATMTMAGKKYSNGFLFRTDTSNYALFNLNGIYNTLEFDVGHLDGYSMINATLNIYLDGNLSFSYDLTPEMLPQHCSVPLNNALQMKIEIVARHVNYQERPYGLANVEIK